MPILSAQELGGAKAHTTKSGVAHLACQNDIDALRQMRALFDFLPLSNSTPCPVRPTSDSRNRADPALDSLIPADSNTP